MAAFVNPPPASASATALQHPPGTSPAARQRRRAQRTARPRSPPHPHRPHRPHLHQALNAQSGWAAQQDLNPETPVDPGPKSDPRTMYIVLLIAAVCTIALNPALRTRIVQSSSSLSTWISSRGLVLGPLILGSLQALACVCCLPSIWFTLTAGYLFGPAIGTATAFCAKFTGACLSFFIGRHLLRDRVLRALARHPRLQKLLQSASAQGWKMVLFLRLGPVPNAFCSYILSVTSVPATVYAATTAVGLLPSVIQTVLCGSALGSSTSLTSRLLILGAALCVFLMSKVAKTKASALADDVEDPSEPTKS